MYAMPDIESNEIEPLLTVSQVAVILGLTAGTVRQYAKLGKLPTVPLNCRAVRFDPTEIRAWIESRKRPARLAA
jgi:excisionase family DNA binding protein